jgi:hypothetical protein
MAMKSPWQLGFLALTLTGVSTYNIFFFKNRSHSPQFSQTAETQSAPAGGVNPLFTPPAAPENANPEALPPISREDLNRLAQQAYEPKDDPAMLSENQWPKRDPFSLNWRRDPEPARVRTIEKPRMAEIPAALEKPAEPQCQFSGALIQEDNRLALVDGAPLAIGARIGAWQLLQIEADHIILRDGAETRRIDIKGAEPQDARRKDAL